MKKIFYTLLAVFSIFIIKIEKTTAQDFHYTQFYNSPLNLNPALTGVFNGDQRFIGSFRQQWAKINESWMTVGGSYDTKLRPKKSSKGFFGVGAQFNYDIDGLSKLNLANLNLSGSYSYALNKSNILTGGLTLGFASRGFNEKALSWDEQWNGSAYVANDPSGEGFDASRVNILESAVGLNYRWQKSTRTKIDLGAGLFHLTSPKADYYNAEGQRLPRRLSLYAIANVQLTQFLDVQVQAINQSQEEYGETLFGGLLKFYLSQKSGGNAQLHLGLGYRTSESLYPTIAVQWGDWYAGLSYDVDLSPFNTHTSKAGGPELHVRYIISKVKPLAARKACPIF